MTETIGARLNDVPPEGVRANIATKLWYEHQERMAQATRSSGPSVTVDLDSNAKRETIPKVQIVAAVGTDEATLRAHAEMVTRVALEQYETITARYPAASGFTTNDGKKGES